MLVAPSSGPFFFCTYSHLSLLVVPGFQKADFPWRSKSIRPAFKYPRGTIFEIRHAIHDRNDRKTFLELDYCAMSPLHTSHQRYLCLAIGLIDTVNRAGALPSSTKPHSDFDSAVTIKKSDGDMSRPGYLHPQIPSPSVSTLASTQHTITTSPFQSSFTTPINPTNSAHANNGI